MEYAAGGCQSEKGRGLRRKSASDIWSYFWRLASKEPEHQVAPIVWSVLLRLMVKKKEKLNVTES